jgi:hypothetical protein
MEFTVETPLNDCRDSSILNPTATTISSCFSAPSTGTSNGNDADALPVGFEELIAWTRGNSLHPTSPSVHGDSLHPAAPSVHDDNVHPTSPSAHDDNYLTMQPNTKRNGSDPSSAIEIGCDGGDEDKPRPPDPRPALVVC